MQTYQNQSFKIPAQRKKLTIPSVYSTTKDHYFHYWKVYDAVFHLPSIPLVTTTISPLLFIFIAVLKSYLHVSFNSYPYSVASRDQIS